MLKIINYHPQRICGLIYATRKIASLRLGVKHVFNHKTGATLQMKNIVLSSPENILKPLPVHPRVKFPIYDSKRKVGAYFYAENMPGSSPETTIKSTPGAPLQLNSILKSCNPKNHGSDKKNIPKSSP